MRILLVHNSYQSGSSGEYVVFASEKVLLESRGHEVVTFEKFNDDIDAFSRWRKLSLLWKTTWSDESYRQMKRVIRRERPDVAHFHNTLPLISPSAFYACQEEGVPVVKTLHNYRLFCASGILMRGERVCDECLSHGPWRGVLYGCYRGSRIQTAAVAHMVWSHRRKGTWAERIDAYIALTEFSRRLFVQAGLPAHKVFIKPNFSNLEVPRPGKSGGYAIYLGRLAGYEGVRTLLSAWRKLPGVPLKIVGDGALRRELEETARKHDLGNVMFFGYQPWERCMELLGEASFLVIPSEHHEGFPCVIAEAYGLGKPVLASRLEPLPELIKDGETGMLFDTASPDDLAAKAGQMAQDINRTERMGRAARTEFEGKYSPGRNYELLMQIYEKVIKNKKRGGS